MGSSMAMMRHRAVCDAESVSLRVPSASHDRTPAAELSALVSRVSIGDRAAFAVRTRALTRARACLHIST
ncbi:MAG: hypothetical protein WKF73_18395 [Nocardioidaceae bacterium]